MTDKQKITEILKVYTKKHNISASSVILEEYAEELLANGVIYPPCKVGDVVYSFCDVFGRFLPYVVQNFGIGKQLHTQRKQTNYLMKLILTLMI